MQETDLNRRLSDRLPARIKQVSYLQLIVNTSVTKLFRIVGGMLLAVALLIPLFIIPISVILVLPSEVYLLDWVHTQYTKSLAKKSIFDRSSESHNDFDDAEHKRTALSRSQEFTR